MDNTPVLVKCRSGCGRKGDVQAQVRIHKRLGLRGKISWQCVECFKAEYAVIRAENATRDPS